MDEGENVLLDGYRLSGRLALWPEKVSRIRTSPPSSAVPSFGSGCILVLPGSLVAQRSKRV